MELLHLQASNKSFPMIVDELDESGSSIRNEFLKLLLHPYPLDWLWSPFFLGRVC
jgi:hypothetical protein